MARGSGQTSAPRASSPPLRTGAAHHRQVSTEPRQGRHAHWSAGAPRPRAVARHKIRGPPCCSPGSGRESTHTTRVSTRRKGHAGARGPGPLHLETRTASGCHGSPASPASPLSGCLQPHGPCLGAGRGGAGPACTEACQGHRERPRHSSPTSQGPKDGSPRPAPRPPTRQQGAPRRHIQAHWGNLRHTPDTTGKPKPLAPPLPQDFRQDSPPLRKPSLFLCSLPLSLSLSVPPAVTLSLASARAPKLSLLCWTHPTHDQPLALTRVCPCQPALQEPQHGRTDATLP